MLVRPRALLLSDLNGFISSLGALYVSLYINNLTPVPSNGIGDFVFETASVEGAQLLSGLTSAALDVDTAFVQWNDVLWHYGPGPSVSIYGYAVHDSTRSTLHWSERNPTAPFVFGPGTTYTVKPYYSRRNQTT